MSEKPSRWTNPEFLTSLMMCFYGQLKGDGLSKETKDAIEARLQKEGHTHVTWNGIRQHLQKLQKKEATAATDNGEGSSTSVAPTPKKSPVKKATTPRKRKTPKQSKSEDGVDEEDQKPPKRPKAPARPDFKEVNEAEAAEELADCQKAGGDSFVPKDGFV